MRKEGKDFDNSLKSVYADSAPKLSDSDEKAEKELTEKMETDEDIKG